MLRYIIYIFGNIGRKSLYEGRVHANKEYHLGVPVLYSVFAGTLPAAYSLFEGTLPAVCLLYAGTVPVYNHFHIKKN